jgi:hypothetical protein
MAPGIASFTVAATVFGLVLLNVAAAQDKAAPVPIPLKLIHIRSGPAFTAEKIGRSVVVEGVVTLHAINVGEYTLLPIADWQGTGLTLERERSALGQFSPGDKIKATGIISQRSGMPVVVVETIVKTGSQLPPAPVELSVQALTEFANVGRFVTIETTLVGVGRNSGGDVPSSAGRLQAL